MYFQKHTSPDLQWRFYKGNEKIKNLLAIRACHVNQKQNKEKYKEARGKVNLVTVNR